MPRSLEPIKAKRAACQNGSIEAKVLDCFITDIEGQTYGQYRDMVMERYGCLIASMPDTDLQPIRNLMAEAWGLYFDSSPAVTA